METSDAITDTELLRAWSGRRCQPSFRALVEKYLGLVEGVAMRRTGNAALAGDVVQAVFAALATKAGRIHAEPTLAPWLHHCAWCESTSALRREYTRTRHMKAYADHLRASGDSGSPAPLHDALPHLDAALQALPRDDQRIVLMRFFEGRALRDIAAALGKTEAAVRKQGQRALDKMALRLRRKGVGISTAALAAGLGAVLSPPASAAAVTAISTSAITAGAKLTLLDHLLTLMNAKSKIALITAGCMALPLIWQWRHASDLEDKLADATRDTRALKSANSMLLHREPRSSRSNTSLPAGAAPASAGSVADWEAALKHPDPLQRMARLASLMSALTPETAPEVATLFKRLREETGGNHLYETEHRNFLRAWGRLDGAAAITSLQGADGKPADSSETLAALAGWAQTDPDRARTWLESLPPGDTATALALGLIDGWSLRDFDAAAAFASTLPRSTVRDQFRSLLLQRALTSGGVPEAQRWFTGIPDNEHNQLYKQRAFDELIAALMARDPSGAAAWITRMGRQDFMSGDAVPELAARLASSSPAEALRWLETLGPGTGDASGKTSAGFARVLDTWAGKDPVAAGTWLQSQSSHPAYDDMAAVYAGRLGATDGDSALAWADSIQDESRRRSARDAAARGMLQARGDEARATLAAAGYSSDQLDKLSQSNKSYELYNTQLTLGARTALDWNSVYADTSYVQLTRANEVQLETLRTDRAQKALALTFSAEGDTLLQELPSPASLDTGSDAYSRAHPGGAPANCAQCHQ
jgi:RNA polymerase sigma factor (sigma-70 family)